MRYIRLAVAFVLALQVTAFSAFAAEVAAGEGQPPANANANNAADKIEGTFESFDPSTSTVKVLLGTPDSKSLVISDPGPTAVFADARTGDRLVFVPDDVKSPTILKKLLELSRVTSGQDRAITLALSFAAIVGVAGLMLRRSPLAFLVGVDNRYSNSQTQMALWFATLATVYAGTVVLRIWSLGFDYVGGVSIPENLLLLSGLSAFTFGGAKVVTVQKTESAGEDKPKATAPRLADLVQNDDKEADLGDFQMIFITFAAVGIFSVSAFHFLGRLSLLGGVTLPDVDSTLLGGFALGQGAYLFNKVALPPRKG
jgi:hypothetical protein